MDGLVAQFKGGIPFLTKIWFTSYLKVIKDYYNEHNASARGVKMITISRAQRGNSLTEPTAQQEVLLKI